MDKCLSIVASWIEREDIKGNKGRELNFNIRVENQGSRVIFIKLFFTIDASVK